jgi:hypothetical protein
MTQKLWRWVSDLRQKPVVGRAGAPFESTG